MFYVIGSEDQSRVLLHTAPANRTKGVVEQFGTSGVPIPCRMNRLIMSQYGRTFLFGCYVCVDKISTALLYKKWRFPVNAVIVNFMRRGGSTFCCYPLITTQWRRANLSTAGKARSSWPLTWAIGSATRCRKVLSLYSEFQITKLKCLRENYSAQVGQNIKNHFLTTWQIFKHQLLPHLDRSWYYIFFRIDQIDKLEFALIVSLYRTLFLHYKHRIVQLFHHQSIELPCSFQALTDHL